MRTTVRVLVALLLVAFCASLLTFFHIRHFEQLCVADRAAAGCLRVPMDPGAQLGPLLWVALSLTVFGAAILVVVFVWNERKLSLSRPRGGRGRTLTFVLMALFVIPVAFLGASVVSADHLCQTTPQSVGCIEAYGTWKTFYYWLCGLALVDTALTALLVRNEAS